METSAIRWLISLLLNWMALAASLPQDGDIRQDLYHLMEKTLEDQLIAHKVRHSRAKREALPITTDKLGFARLYNISQASIDWHCHHALKASLITARNGSTYGLCIKRNVDGRFNYLLYLFPDKILFDIEDVDTPSDIAAFAPDDGNIYFLIAYPERHDQAVELIQHNPRLAKTEVFFNIQSKRPTTIALWQMQGDKSFRLAVASSCEAQDGVLSNNIEFSVWKGTYFDPELNKEVVGYDVRDIAPFHFHNNDYLAVANHRNSEFNYDVKSEIFKYDFASESWKSHQCIVSFAAVDLELFSFGKNIEEELFLAVANQFIFEKFKIYRENSVAIYKMVNERFVFFQYLSILGPTKLASYRGSNDEFVLAISSLFDSVQLFQYNGWQFHNTGFKVGKYASLGSFYHLLPHWNNPMIFITSEGDPSLFFENIFKHENSMQMWHERSMMWCNRTMDSIKTLDLKQIYNEVDSSLKINQEEPIVFNSSLHLGENITIKALQTLEFSSVTPEHTFDDSLLLDLEQIFFKIERLKREIQNLSSVVFSSLKKNEAQIITGEYNFENLFINCDSNCKINQINSTAINKKEVLEYFNKAIFKDEVNNLSYMNVGTAIVSSNMNVSKTLNNITTLDILFEDDFMNELKILGNALVDSDVYLLNGLPFGTNSLLLDSIDQTFHGIEVSNLSVNKLNTSSFNGNALNDNHFILKGLATPIYGSKTFENLVLYKADIEFINDINLIDLWNNSFWLDESQTVTSSITFEEISAETIEAKSLNEIQIPGTEVILLWENKTLYEDLKFSSTALVRKLEVYNRINNLNILHDNNFNTYLNAILKNGPRIVKGNPIFDNMKLIGNSDIQFLNNEKFEDLISKMNENEKPKGTWYFENIMIKGPLTVNSFNDINVDNLFDNILLITYPKEIKATSLVILNGASFSEIHSYNINGIDFTKDVAKKSFAIIKHPVHFERLQLLGDIEVEGLINGVNISDQTPSLGDFIIVRGNLTVDKLVIDGEINGINLDDVILINSNQAVTGPVHFSETIAVGGSLHARDVYVGSVNGVNLEQLYYDTLTYSGQQVVPGHKNIHGNLNLAPGADLDTYAINGVNPRSIFNDTLPLNETIVVYENVTFSNDVNIDNIWYSQGDNIWSLSEDFILNNQQQNLYGNMKVAGLINVKDLEVESSINSIKLEELAEDIVKLNEISQVTGLVEFEDNVIVNRDIFVHGTVKDVNMDTVVTEPDKKVELKKKTLSDITVTNEIVIEGLLNGINISDICQRAVRTNSLQKLKSLEIVGTASIPHLAIEGLVNGANLSDIFSNCAKSKESNVFSNNIKFEELRLVKGNMNLTGNFGNFNLDYLENSHMSRRYSQKLGDKVHFKIPLLSVGELEVEMITYLNGKINGIDIENLSTNTLKKSGNKKIENEITFEGSLSFLDNLDVAGKVSGIKIPDDLVLLGNPVNVITTPTIWNGELRIKNKAEIEDFNGVHLEHWQKSLVRNSEKKIDILGSALFSNIHLHNVQVDGLFNNRIFSNSSVFLDKEDQDILGFYNYINDLEAKSFAITGTINQTYIEPLYKHLAKVDENNVLFNKTFSKPISINTLDSAFLRKSLENLQNISPLSMERVGNRVEYNENFLKSLELYIKNKLIVFDYFEMIQKLESMLILSAAYTTIPGDAGSLLALGVRPAPGEPKSVLIYSLHSSKFVNIQTITAPGFSNLDFGIVGNDLYLFVAKANFDQDCNMKIILNEDSNFVSIYKWENEDFKFKHSQNISENPAFDIAFFLIKIFNNWEYCIIYTEKGVKAKIFCMGSDQTFKYRTTIPGNPASKIILSYRKDLLIAFWYRQGLDYQIEILRMSNLEEYYTTTMAGKVAKAETFQLVESSDHRFFFVGESKNSRQLSTLKIFKENQEGAFELYQTLETETVESLDTTIHPNGDLLVATVADGEVKMYRHQGASGFTLELKIPYEGAQKVTFIRDISVPLLLLSGTRTTGPSTNYFAHILAPRFYKR